jgi:hypothetical protein
MPIPNVNNPAPSDPEIRKQIITESSDEQLEKLLDHAHGMMDALLNGLKPVHADYQVWSAFVGEIKSERGKRAEHSG